MPTSPPSITIKLKRSDVSGVQPPVENIEYGELALNTADGLLFFKKKVGDIDQLVQIRQLNAGSGVSITDGNIHVGQDIGNTATPTFAGLTVSPTGYSNSLVVYPSGNVNVGFNLTLAGTLTDSTNSVGSSGQVLTSTVTGVSWQNLVSSGSSSTPIKTFNIFGTFTGFLTGTARFYSVSNDTIRSAILTVVGTLQQNLNMALLRNNEVVQIFTIPSGTDHTSYSNLNIIIQPNDSYTVNILSGSGTNLALALFNINL